MPILCSCLEREGIRGHRCQECKKFEDDVDKNVSKIREKKRGNLGKRYRCSNKKEIELSPLISQRIEAMSVKGRAADRASVHATPQHKYPKHGHRPKHRFPITAHHLNSRKISLGLAQQKMSMDVHRRLDPPTYKTNSICICLPLLIEVPNIPRRRWIQKHHFRLRSPPLPMDKQTHSTFLHTRLQYVPIHHP
jgi:hypothetical protein